MSEQPADARAPDPGAPDPGTPDPAKGRFVMIQLARLIGVFMVLFGILLQDGRIVALREVPRAVGFVLIAIGLLDVFVMPVILARRWRSKP